jgi:hypothetical protein
LGDTARAAKSLAESMTDADRRSAITALSISPLSFEPELFEKNDFK